MKTAKSFIAGFVLALVLIGASRLVADNGATSAPQVRVQEEGALQGAAPTLNFVGSAVTAVVSGGVATITVSGGGGGLDHPAVMSRQSLGF